jgi:hypothetical protein
MFREKGVGPKTDLLGRIHVSVPESGLVRTDTRAHT